MFVIHYKGCLKQIFGTWVGSLDTIGENRFDPEKSGLNSVLLIHSPFLLPSFYRREKKKGKK